MTRITQAVRYLWDYDAVPPKTYEAATWSPDALALRVGATWNHPSHGDGAMVTGRWGVIRRAAPASARPVWMTYDRAEPLPWAVEDPDHRAAPERFAQMVDAMQAAVGEVA
jgi:hypothetical protein